MGGSAATFGADPSFNAYIICNIHSKVSPPMRLCLIIHCIFFLEVKLKMISSGGAVL